MAYHILSSHLNQPSHYSSFNLLMKQVSLSLSLSITLKPSLLLDTWSGQVWKIYLKV